MLQREQSVILSTCIKLSFVIKTFVLSIFEWPLKTGFTVYFDLYPNKTNRIHHRCSLGTGKSQPEVLFFQLETRIAEFPTGQWV